MRIELAGQPAYAVAYLRLDHGESVYCEPGAMVAMSAGIEAGGSLEGGVVRAAFRKAFGDEKFFLARYTAEVHGAWVALSPRFPGDIAAVPVRDGDGVALQSGAMLAFSDGVDIDVRWAGVRKILMREGATVLRASGEGTLLIGSYGAIQQMTLGVGETVIVDSGHLVAWSAGMGVRIGPLAGVVGQALTGEGLVAELTGPGQVWIQTRAEQQLVSWLFPERHHNTGP